jgi:MFS family permease
MAWLVFELSGSALNLGLLGGVTAIPTMASTLVGGILADRFNRRSILVVTTLTSAILLLVLTLLDAVGIVLVWHVLVVAGLLGLVQGFDMPARSSIFPALIQPHQMMSAVMLNAILWQGTRMILPAIGGILIAIADTALVFGICTFGFLAMVWVLRSIEVEHAFVEKKNPWHELSEGVKFVLQNQIFRILILLTFSMHFFGTSYIQIMPMFADLLGSGESGYGLLISITGIGSVIGTFLIGKFQQARRLGWVIFASVVLSPSALLGFSLVTSMSMGSVFGFVFASLFVVLSAMFGAAFLVSSMTVLQLIVPDELRGRVMGIHSITFSLISLGGLVTGVLASTFNAPIAVTIGALLVVTITFLTMIRHREILHLDGRNL